MKKTLLLFVVAASMYACGGGNDKTDSAATEKKEESKVPDDPAYTEGMTLVANGGCPTCHKIDEASTGPEYRKVAEKYANTPENISMLAGKVIKGGAGNWGTIPMTPHPDVSPENAAKMVKYILMLKK
ncbi:MAG: c-type cytochrome [Bacteroidota bacterium]